MAVDQGNQSFGAIKSPSAQKPTQIAAALSYYEIENTQDNIIEFIEPQPFSVDDFKLAHDPNYVDRIFNLQEENGFGNKSPEVAESLKYTNGAMYDAAVLATSQFPTCALVSGFHHAGYNSWSKFGYFCTFNGLMLTAIRFRSQGKKTLILDLDMHYGNGTDDILEKLKPDNIIHITFGEFFYNKHHAEQYLASLDTVEEIVEQESPDIILYQAGADVHIDDPYGGILTTEQIYERDLKVFSIARKFHVPICWNLAGGYQI